MAQISLGRVAWNACIAGRGITHIPHNLSKQYLSKSACYAHHLSREELLDVNQSEVNTQHFRCFIPTIYNCCYLRLESRFMPYTMTLCLLLSTHACLTDERRAAADLALVRRCVIVR